MSWLADISQFWLWLVLGGVFLILEVLIPGVYLFWLGLAALTSALLGYLVGFGWQGHSVIFTLAAFGFVAIGIVISRRQRDEGATSHSGRFDHYIGLETALVDPVQGGYGRIRIGDTTWRVRGRDMPEGTLVRITSVNQGDIQVEAVTQTTKP